MKNRSESITAPGAVVAKQLKRKNMTEVELAAQWGVR